MTDSLKSITLTSAVSLVVANMVGAGVFTTSGFALADLGDPIRVLAAWLVGGLVALCGAVSYGSLSRRFNESGGEYLFLARSVHPLAGFVAGWISFLAGFTGAIAFAATGFEHYVLPESVRPGWLPQGTVAVSAIIATALLHGYRVGPAARTQDILVGLKVLLLVIFISLTVVLLPRGEWKGLSNGAPATNGFPFSAFALSLVWISLSYSGFNAAVYIASEVHQPAKNVPKALLLGTLVVIALYLALNAVFVLAPAYQEAAGQPDVAAAAARSLGGSWFPAAVRVLISLALLTSVSAMIMSGPRVYAKMAEDRVFPRWFMFKQETPRAAIALQAAAAVLVTTVSDLRELLSYLGFTLSVSAALTISTIFVLRFKEGAAAVPVPLFPIPPLIFISATFLFAGIAATRNPWECVAGMVTIASGIGAYAAFRPFAKS